MEAFADHSETDFEIQNISMKVSTLINACESNIKEINRFVEIEKEQGRISESKFLRNMVRSLATQIQEKTMIFRKEQKFLFENLRKMNNYDEVEFLDKSTERMNNGDLEEYGVSEMEMIESQTRGRDSEITRLVDSINHLTSIFKQMNTLVIEQGLIIDRIDYNLEHTLEETKKGNVELRKAETHAKSNRGRNCIFLLSGLIVIFVVILILKYRDRK